jgi:signal transduction histidine kinase
MRQAARPPAAHGRSPAAQRLALFSAAVLATGGLLVLAGWHFRIPALRGEMLGTFVAANTALLFLLVAASALLQWSRYRIARAAGIALGLLVAAAAAAMLFEHVTDIDMGIARLFFAHRLDDWTVASPPGRIAVPTAFAFLFAGISLVALRWRARTPLAEAAALVVGATAYLALIGYLVDLPYLYGHLMAFPTALLLFTTALLLLAATEQGRFTAILLSHGPGGIAFRRIGLVAILLMPFLGWLLLQTESLAWLTLEQTVAFYVVAVVLLFTLLSWNTASLLNAIDAQRRDALAALIRTEKLAATGRLAASVAHEINNPLEAVMNLLYLARERPDGDPAARALLDKADAELLRIAQITRQTLGFYRGSSRPAHVWLAPITQEVMALYRGRAASLNAALRATGHDACIVADPGEMRQIIANLVANALDAVSRDGAGEVTISILDRGLEWIELSVSDNGPGIPPENIEHVFEPFFTTKAEHGTGLGLYLARQLAEKNGGMVELRNGWENGGGVTVTVTCPRARAARAAREAG